jgi:hypothetical protein
MDVPLYAIALAVFAVLYLAIGVFLAFAILITLLVMFAYLVVRYRELPANYPYSSKDAATTMIFIGITWAIFTFVADKNPVPFIGSGLTYTNQSLIPLDAIIAIAFIVSIVFLVIFAFVVPRFGEGEGMSSESESGDGPKKGIGA